MVGTDLLKGQRYRHYKKGSVYEIICIATHSETEEDMVVYRDVATGRNFVRPQVMFVELVEFDGRTVSRFALVEGADGKV